MTETPNEHGIERRVTKRVEYRIPTRNYAAIQAVTAAALEDAARHGVDDPPSAVWYQADGDGATLVFDVPVEDYELDPHQRRQVLAAALDAPTTATWPTLLEIARARSVALRELLTESAPATVALGATTPPNGDAPIAALLPRRWPEEVDRLVRAVPPLEPQRTADRVKQLVDRWVLTAANVTHPAIEPCD